jgi:hypothetical protein
MSRYNFTDEEEIITKDDIAKKLEGIPDEPPEPKIAITKKVKAEGKKLGFVSREPWEERIIATPEKLGQTTQINIRLPISSANLFLQWCQDERMSQREGLEQLISLAGLRKDNK